jgi:hypothetical protein
MTTFAKLKQSIKPVPLLIRERFGYSLISG